MIKEDLKDNIKELIGPIVFICGVTAIIILLLTVQKSLNRVTKNKEEFTYVSKIILPDTIPVVSTSEELIGLPYSNESVKQVRNFYDYTKDSTDQKNSLIFYDNTYIQNSGLDYSGNEPFDAVSILDGTVTSVKEDQMLGNIVEVKHSNELISVYQSLSEVKVKKDQKITKGEVIGTSGTNNISSSLDNHLHFELYYKGQVVNPNDYYNKALKDLK